MPDRCAAFPLRLTPAMPWCPHSQSRGRLQFLHQLLPRVASQPKGDTGGILWCRCDRRQEGWSRRPERVGRLRWRALHRHVAPEACAGAGARQGAAASWPAPACRTGSVPGPVSACTVVAKLTPCARRRAGAGCSLRHKGVGSPRELPGGVGACPGGTPAGKPCSAGASCRSTARAPPLLRAPGAAEAQPEVWGTLDPPWGLPSPNPSPLAPIPPEQPAADSPDFPAAPTLLEKYGLVPAPARDTRSLRCHRNRQSTGTHPVPPRQAGPSPRLCTGNQHSFSGPPAMPAQAGLAAAKPSARSTADK